MSTSAPSSHFGFPMWHVGLDLFFFARKEYLICVDHLYQLLQSLTSDAIIKVLSLWFNMLGWPSSILSNGGPKFRGDFVQFCNKNGIHHELSALYNPKGNDLAKGGVKSVKNILRKCISSGADANFMLYEWRNVPCSDGYSPSQLMFGRNQRTCLPSLPSQNPPIDFHQAAVSKDSLHMRSKLDRDRSKLSLPLLSPGQRVHLEDSKSSTRDQQGVIVSMRPNKLSYVINMDNRFFTRPRPSSTPRRP